MSKLDEWLDKNGQDKEDFIQAVFYDNYRKEAKESIKALMLEIIGEDEHQKWDKYYDFCEWCDFQPTDDTQDCVCVFRNKLRAELRKKVEAL